MKGIKILGFLSFWSENCYKTVRIVILHRRSEFWLDGVLYKMKNSEVFTYRFSVFEVQIELD